MGSADFVFTFVNPYDSEWRREYAKWFNDEPTQNPRQNKSPRLLRYFLRSVAKNIPWAGRTYMVVASESQVPSWVNRDAVEVVTHEDIIDAVQLPTFNTMTIIKYLNLIPGLGERYIYSNDDWYAMRPIAESQCFDEDGNPVQHSSSVEVVGYENPVALNDGVRKSKYLSICLNTYRRFRQAFGPEAFAGIVPDDGLHVPKFMHNYMICRKTEVERMEGKIQARLDVFHKGREFSDYDVMSGYVIMNAAKTPLGRGVLASTALHDKIFVDMRMGMPVDKFNAFLEERLGESQCFCINQSSERVRDMVAQWLDRKFPDKCKYEV